MAFPGEKLNLHIFEPRYIALINDCIQGGGRFGIPSFVFNKIDYGTEMSIVEVVKKYEDGRMDISTRCERIIKVVEFVNPWQGKLYAGGSIALLDNVDDSTPLVKEEMHVLLKELFQSIQVVEAADIASDAGSFDVGHHVGLSIEQEYELIQIESENERQVYLIEQPVV